MILRCPLKDLPLLKEDLDKLLAAIDGLGVDSSFLRVWIVELMATSVEYSSLHSISSEKLILEVRDRQLAAIDSSFTQARSLQQAVTDRHQLLVGSLAFTNSRIEALKKEQEQLEADVTQLHHSLLEYEALISQRRDEIVCLEGEKALTAELPTLSAADADALKTSQGLLETQRHGFKDLVWE